MENSRSKLLIVTLTVLLLLFYWSFFILGSGFNSKHNSEAQYQNKLQLSVIVSLVSMFQSKTRICSIGILFYLSINIPVTILTNNIFSFFPRESRQVLWKSSLVYHQTFRKIQRQVIFFSISQGSELILWIKGENWLTFVKEKELMDLFYGEIWIVMPFCDWLDHEGYMCLDKSEEIETVMWPRRTVNCLVISAMSSDGDNL